MVRKVYLISYDVSDAKRLRKAARVLEGYGLRLHYSVFRCDLSQGEYYRLVADLTDVLHLGKDRFLLADLGPCRGSGPQRIRFFGRAAESEDDGLALIF